MPFYVQQVLADSTMLEVGKHNTRKNALIQFENIKLDDKTAWATVVLNSRKVSEVIAYWERT